MNEEKEIINCGFIGKYTNEFTDMVLEVDGNEIAVHRPVLAVRSDYFKVMFYGEFAESKKDRIQLHDMKWIQFKKVIEYLYTGRLLVTPREVHEIYSIAHMLGLTYEAEKICCFMAQGTMYVCTFPEYINCAYKFDLPVLKEICSAVWSSNLKSLDNFIGRLSEDAVLGLLSNNLNYKFAGKPIDEEEKFNLASRWLEANDKSKAQVLMSKIKLSNLKTETLRDRVWPSGFLTETQLLEELFRRLK